MKEITNKIQEIEKEIKYGDLTDEEKEKLKRMRETESNDKTKM